MKRLLRVVLILFALKVTGKCFTSATFEQKSILELQYINSETLNIYQQLLMDIAKERSFDALLIIGHSIGNDLRLNNIYSVTVPKVIVTKDYGFHYKLQFNSNILIIIILDNANDLSIMKTAANILQFMRQSRILIVAINIDNLGIFKTHLLQLCRQYQMTNVLVNVSNNQQQQYSYLLFALKPYPTYHWITHNNVSYYLQHWPNMQNISLVTITDKVVPHSFIFKDAQDNPKLSGFVAKLILLFAERVNASLKIYRPLQELGNLPFIVVNKMLEDNLLDIPMVPSPITDDGWQHGSYVIEIGKAILMIPCAQSLTTREVFGILLNPYFFGSVLIYTWLISLIHSVIDYLFTGAVELTNFLLSDKIFPGILGQSFAARNLPSRSLKLLYMLVFLAGLNISTQFAANIKTLFTRPPHHKQIKTFEDLQNSNLKILVPAAEVPILNEETNQFATSMVLTDNIASYHEERRNFNTSYGYLASSMVWEIFTRHQQYFTHKIFCTYEGLSLFNRIPWTVRLPPNSPLKEPLDNLIHRVHDMGLMEIWHSNTFSDILRLKQVSIIDPNPSKGLNILSVNDLFLVWTIAVYGLLASTVVFVLELSIVHGSAICRNSRNR